MIFQTQNLIVRKSTDCTDDIDMYFELWNDPQVMTNVGYPKGLKIGRDKIQAIIQRQNKTEYDKTLVVELKETGQPIGECKLGLPSDESISTTDVKLLPRFWGNRFGIEVKKGLIDYLFTNTDCKAIEASPNKNNIASQKMQEAVGGKKVDKGIYRFPPEMSEFTADVHYIIYMVNRKDWEKSAD